MWHGSAHPKAKADLHQIWRAETREQARKALGHFMEKVGINYEAACACLAENRDVLVAFSDFPAEHWSHLRTMTAIESTFATIRLRIAARRTAARGEPASR